MIKKRIGYGEMINFQDEGMVVPVILDNGNGPEMIAYVNENDSMIILNATLARSAMDQIVEALDSEIKSEVKKALDKNQ